MANRTAARGRAYRQVLEEPRPQDVSGHLGEDPSLLVVQFVPVGVVVVAGAGRRQAVVQAVACTQKEIQPRVQTAQQNRAGLNRTEQGQIEPGRLLH